MPVITRLPPSYEKIDIKRKEKRKRERERAIRIGESLGKQNISFLIRRIYSLGKEEKCHIDNATIIPAVAEEIAQKKEKKTEHGPEEKESSIVLLST